MERLSNMLESVRSYWTNLTDRERLLLGVLGAVASALVIFLPVYLLAASIGELEDENEQITSTLRDLSRARGQLRAQQAARAAADSRYALQPPALGEFFDAKRREQEVTLADMRNEPEREEGDFRIHHARARIQGTGLRSAVLFLTAIKNSRYPVAIERIHIDHHQAGDRYNVEVGVLAYHRSGGPDAGAPAVPDRPAQGSSGGRGRAGPPPPE